MRKSPGMSQTLTPAIRPPTDTTIVRSVGLRKSYMMGEQLTEVLRAVDLDIAAGEFIAIEGRSGSAKSTLLHLLGMLDTPDSGTIEFDGQNLATLSAAEPCRLRDRHAAFV